MSQERHMWDSQHCEEIIDCYEVKNTYSVAETPLTSAQVVSRSSLSSEGRIFKFPKFCLPESPQDKHNLRLNEDTSTGFTTRFNALQDIKLPPGCRESAVGIRKRGVIKITETGSDVHGICNFRNKNNNLWRL